MIYVPRDVRTARRQLRAGCAASLSQMAKPNFLRIWHSAAYLYPGLNPDGFEEADNGWPSRLRKVVTEVWRRADAGQLSDEELYPSDAAWAGIYDRMDKHTEDEVRHRTELYPFGAGK